MQSGLFKLLASRLWMTLIGGKGDLKPLLNETAMIKEKDLSSELCVSLMERIDNELDRGSWKKIWQDEHHSDNRILEFEKLIPDLIDHLEIEKKIKAVDDYTGRRTKSWYLMANKLVPSPNNKGSGGGWHRDSAFSHQVKFIWYLNDVGKENGPFQYIPGSHRSSMSENSNSLLKTRFEYVDGENLTIQGKQGTLLICDTKCIHRGKPINSGQRYALTLYTFPSSRGATKNFEKLGL